MTIPDHLRILASANRLDEALEHGSADRVRNAAEGLLEALLPMKPLLTRIKERS